MTSPIGRSAQQNYRPSDAERQQVIDELTRHVTAGRLSVTEFDDRADQVYKSVTRSRVQRVLEDLPELPEPLPPVGVRSRFQVPLHLKIEWTVWFSLSAINLVIWGILALTVDGSVYPWPIWVIAPWGTLLTIRTLTGWENRKTPKLGDDNARTAIGTSAHTRGRPRR
ncbi:MAG: DUF1707 domain-containing protein [Rhodococcus sp.]|nr:DUF1707 domain-containing protein [Rhodococcus sp. (in: high G+C Gram-positive bacteria)]